MSKRNKTLVVLDFNGTILDSTHHRHANVPVNAMARFKYVYYRPHMTEFIQWIMQCPDIVVALWTSNIAKNAQSLVELIFTEEQRQCIQFIYSREHCLCFRDYSSKKPIQRVVDHLVQREQMEISHVLIVDDSPEKIVMCKSPQHDIAIDYYHINTFEASPISLTTDQELPRLKEFIISQLQSV